MVLEITSPSLPSGLPPSPPTNSNLQNTTTILPPSNNTTTPSSSTTTTSPESHLLSALQTLDEIHSSLLSLRSTIPSMISPIMRSHTYLSPEALFADFQAATGRASEELVEFGRVVEGGRWCFEMAERSRKEDGVGGEGGGAGGGIKRWKVSAAGGNGVIGGGSVLGKSMVVKKGDDGNVLKGTITATSTIQKGDIPKTLVTPSNNNTSQGLSPPSIATTISSFKSSHPNIQLEHDVETNKVVITLPKSTPFVFTIEIPPSISTTTTTLNAAPDMTSLSKEGGGKGGGGEREDRILVSLPTTCSLHISILRAVTTRDRKGDLGYLLVCV